MKQLLESVLNARESWKTVFVQNENGEIVQYVNNDIVLCTDIVSIADDSIESYIKDFIQPFDVFRGPLIRSCVISTPTKNVVLIDALHMISDGMTYMNLVQDVSDLSHGRELEPEQITVFQHAQRQKAYDISAEHEEITQFYKNSYRAREFGRIAYEPTDAMGDAIECSLRVDSAGLIAFCNENKIKFAAFLNAAYSILISALTRSNIISFATLLHGRDRKTRRTYGSFISTIPFMVEINPDESIVELCTKVEKNFMAMIRRKDYSFVDFVKNTAFFPETIFTYQGPRIRNEVEVDGFRTYAHQIRYSTATNSPLSLAVYETSDGLELCGECSSRRHDLSFLKTFLQCYANILETMAGSPDTCKVRELSLSKETVSAQAENIRPQDILEKIAMVARSYPERTAIVDSRSSVTYGELWEEVEAYARQLDGQNSGSFVILGTERSSETIVKMLGTLLSGRAYVPVDSALPDERREYMTQDCADAEGYPEAAYMIYTSGSTGKPKGVVVGRRALNAFTAGISEVLGISSADRILCHSSFSFDASVEDIYPILCCGGELHIIPEEMRRDPSAIARYINENGITGGNYTTRLAMTLIDNYDLPGLRYIVFGGEKMQKAPARNPRIRVFNTYGPTEFTVDATYFELQRGVEYDDIPIGRALPGQCALIADHNGNPLPQGMTGEIILSGEQLADGYNGRQDLTAEKFRNSTAVPFGRYYRSGDLGYKDADGEIHFVCRDDRQVKVSGFRIELSEIDKAALAVEGVRDAVSTVSGSAICTYYCGTADADKIKVELQNQLPSYMIPRAFVRMEDFPVGPTGKVDLSSLPKPKLPSCGMTPPENNEEKVLLEIVRSVMETEDIGVTDDLSLYGLSSIQTLEILSRAENSGIHIDISEAFACHTIRGMLGCRRHAEQPFWHNMDKSKPLAVVVCGLTSESEMMPCVTRLSEKYSVWVIPALDSDGHKAEALVQRWIESLPGTAALILGHSFGGELAYMMAVKINERTGETPDLVMIDTTCHIDRALTKKALDSRLIPSRLRLYLSLHDNSHVLGYEGHITLFSAGRRDLEFKILPSHLREGLSAAENESMWLSSNPGLSIRNVKGAGHDSILRSDELCNSF